MEGVEIRMRFWKPVARYVFLLHTKVSVGVAGGEGSCTFVSLRLMGMSSGK